MPLAPPFHRLSLLATVAALAFLSVDAFAADAHSDFYLRDGDRVVFYGDSITEQGHYTWPIEFFVRTHRSDWKIEFINKGWSGDHAWGGDGGMLAERLQRDVIAHRPTVVTVMLGMNDGYYTNFSQQALDAFRSELEKLVATLQRELPGVRITLLGASPYDNVTPGELPEWERGIDGGYNAVIKRFSVAAKDVAAAHGLLVVDMNEPLVDLLGKLQESDSALARQLIPDRIHPGAAAGCAMAARLLTAWNFRATGQSICVDAAGNARDRVTLCQALPLPFVIDRADPLMKLVLAHSPELQSFTDDKLVVAHLPWSAAQLSIDGRQVGNFSSEQLSSGVELSTLDTPLTCRVAEVADLIRIRNRLQFVRWRHLEIPTTSGSSRDRKQAVEELIAVKHEIAKLARAAAQSNSHVLELSRQSR